MKLFKTLTLLGAISVINASAIGETIISDTFTAVNVTNGFLLGAGINSEINPPTSTRLTGTVAADLRYIRRGNKGDSAYSVSSGTNAVITQGLQAGRFSLGDGTTNELGTNIVFDFGPALGVTNATPENRLIYEVGISMNNRVNVNNTNNTVGRMTFAFGTVEGGGGSWSFGVQILPTTNGTYNVYKRIKPLASGLASDLNVLIATNAGTNGTELSFLMRITDAGAEPDTLTNANSRLELSLDAGATWFYDTQSDAALTNGWRLETATRYVSFDQAAQSGQMNYDNFFIQIPEANGGVLSISNNNGSADILFQGIASQEYIIQRSQNLTDWSDISTNTADGSGVIEFNEVPPTNPAFYRTRSP